MKILITGNMGYVGPGVVAQLRKSYPDATLIGYDIGFFAHCLTNVQYLPETLLNQQYFGDVRSIDASILEGVDAIVYLAAISNDPMGKKYEEITLDVNYKSAIQLAETAKKYKVKNFVFASSCSMYGAADDAPKVESDTLNPLTAYARSKVAAEKDLEPIADSSFVITCLRFATACGYSNRLRLDLVLNDFVAGAVTDKKISILSNGKPWRPLINVLDMARAIDWAVIRKTDKGGEFLAVNAGSNEWNYQVKELAEAVAEIVPGTDISINTNAPEDKRSYKVNFDLFKELAPDFQPIHGLKETIDTLYNKLVEMKFDDKDFRNSQFIRLKVLDRYERNKLINNQLIWV